MVSVALPGSARVVRASASEPYLALRRELNPRRIAEIVVLVVLVELVVKVHPRGLPPVPEKSAVYVARVDQRIVRAGTGLLECLAEPGDVELLPRDSDAARTNRSKSLEDRDRTAAGRANALTPSRLCSVWWSRRRRSRPAGLAAHAAEEGAQACSSANWETAACRSRLLVSAACR